MELFKLFGSIMVDNKAANDSISKTEGLASKLSKSIGSGVKKVAGFTVGIGAAAAGGAAALMGVANKAAETTDRIDKLSLKTNLSRQGFQEWDHIMSQSGMSIESLQGGMKKFTGSLDDVAQGNKTMIENFERIGISADELKNKSPEQAFEMTVKALQEMPQSAEKAALANDLLGRAASEMAPILDMSAEATEALRQEAHDLGLVMSDEAVDSGVLFGDTLANVKDSLGMVVSKIGVEVMPIIQQLLQWVIDNMPTIQNVISIAFDYISKFVTAAVDVFKTYLLPVFQSIFEWVQTNLPTIQAVIGAVFDFIGQAVNVVIDIFNNYLLPVFQAIYEWVQANWPAIQEVMTKVFEGIGQAIDVVVEVFTTYLLPALVQVWEWVQDNWPTIQKVIGVVFDAVKKAVDILVQVFKDYLMPIFKDLVRWVQDNWPKIQEVISNVINVIKAIIENVMGAIQYIWENYGEQIKAFAEGIWNNIKIVIDTVINSIKSIIETILALIRGDWEGAWNGIKNYFTGLWDGMKRYVENITTTLKNVFGGAWDSIKEKTSRVWQGIKDAIMTPINWVRDKVKGVIDTIKGFFSFRITWPKIPMPHFGISPRGWKIGDLLKGSIPRLGINWYAKGGIFDSPTIFPTAHGLKGVGEAGPEAVTPIRALREYMIDSVDSMNKPTVQLLERVNKTLEAILEKNTDVVLDGRSMAKELIGPIDQLMATNHKRSRLGG